MELISSFLPLNTKEQLDQLMSELKRYPGAMNPTMRDEIKFNLKKVKMQLYFDEKYPLSEFPDRPRKMVIEANSNSSSPVPEPVSSTPSSPSGLPLPPESKGSKKYIYGTYIEMAFHNFFCNMRQIYLLVFGEDIMQIAARNYVPRNPDDRGWDEDFANERLVWEPMFSRISRSLPEEREKAEELFRRHFPVLKVVEDYVKQKEQFKEYDTIEILRHLSQSLRVLRNEYSHFKFIPFENQVQTYVGNEPFINGVLEHTFLAAKREVKSRFAFDDKAMLCAEQYEFHRDHGKKTKTERKGLTCKTLCLAKDCR